MFRLISRSFIAMTVFAAAALALQGQPAHAVGHTTKNSTAAHAKRATHPDVSGKRYFVEFRGRNAASYGHLYVMYGQVNDRGEIIRSRIAGLYPAGDKPDCENCSLANWMVGHLVFVPSGTTATDGDLEEKYVTARYRVMLDKAQYQKVTDYIAKFQADPPLWHAILRNCVSFGRDIANVLDMKVPSFPLLTPEDFVNQLREMNGKDAVQPALKDAATHIDEPRTAFAHAKPTHGPQMAKHSGQTAAAGGGMSSH